MTLWNLAKPLIFKFDAEHVHHAVLTSLKLTNTVCPALIRWISGAKDTFEMDEVAGKLFPQAVGLAAGFDKNAELLSVLPALGFGFAEMGTVTARPQIGNEKPRLYRLPETSSLFNCMGFNNLGAKRIAQNIEKSKPHLTEFFRVGVNIGKNKDTALEDAADDYRAAISYFNGLCDYVVINVSSPNTVGLRSLQTSEALKPIIEKVLSVTQRWSETPPLFLKLSPEICSANEFENLIESTHRSGVQGYLLTNTLAAREFDKTGGLSGAVLTKKSASALTRFRNSFSYPLISVGGIMDESEACERMKLGADRIQIYSGWIYGGPRFPSRINRAISKFNSERSKI